LIDLYSDGMNSAEGDHWLGQAFVNNDMSRDEVPGADAPRADDDQ
jgi:hypothetical protein